MFNDAPLSWSFLVGATAEQRAAAEEDQRLEVEKKRKYEKMKERKAEKAKQKAERDALSEEEVLDAAHKEALALRGGGKHGHRIINSSSDDSDDDESAMGSGKGKTPAEAVGSAAELLGRKPAASSNKPAARKSAPRHSASSNEGGGTATARKSAPRKSASSNEGGGTAAASMKTPSTSMGDSDKLMSPADVLAYLDTVQTPSGQLLDDGHRKVQLPPPSGEWVNMHNLELIQIADQIVMRKSPNSKGGKANINTRRAKLSLADHQEIKNQSEFSSVYYDAKDSLLLAKHFFVFSDAPRIKEKRSGSAKRAKKRDSSGNLTKFESGRLSDTNTVIEVTSKMLGGTEKYDWTCAVKGTVGEEDCEMVALTGAAMTSMNKFCLKLAHNGQVAEDLGGGGMFQGRHQNGQLCGKPDCKRRCAAFVPPSESERASGAYALAVIRERPINVEDQEKKVEAKKKAAEAKTAKSGESGEEGETSRIMGYAILLKDALKGQNVPAEVFREVLFNEVVGDVKDRTKHLLLVDEWSKNGELLWYQKCTGGIKDLTEEKINDGSMTPCSYSIRQGLGGEVSKAEMRNLIDSVYQGVAKLHTLDDDKNPTKMDIFPFLKGVISAELNFFAKLIYKFEMTWEQIDELCDDWQASGKRFNICHGCNNGVSPRIKVTDGKRGDEFRQLHVCDNPDCLSFRAQLSNFHDETTFYLCMKVAKENMVGEDAWVIKMLDHYRDLHGAKIVFPTANGTPVYKTDNVVYGQQVALKR